MSECANLFCRNVYSNISTQNNIALTLCWKTTKKYKAQYVLFDQPARRPVTQPHRSEERFWPSASICGFPSFNSPENVVPSRFFVICFFKPGECHSTTVVNDCTCLFFKECFEDSMKMYFIQKTNIMFL